MAVEAQSLLLANCWMALPLYTGFFEDAALSSIRHSGPGGHIITSIMGTLTVDITMDITGYPGTGYNVGLLMSPISAAHAGNVLRYHPVRGLELVKKYSLRPSRKP